MTPVVFAVQRDFMLPAFHLVASRYPITLVRRREDLTVEFLNSCRAQHLIVADWSWIIPEEIVANWSCIGFHASSLPDYRGGSPLQHQILDGVSTTRLSCIRLDRGIDTGPILLQEDLSLDGTISEIWMRITALVGPMVLRVLAGDYRECPQASGGFSRIRRRPEESRIPSFGLSFSKLYDWMRALDDPYPNAFIEVEDKRIYFRNPRQVGGELRAEVVIKEVKNG